MKTIYLFNKALLIFASLVFSCHLSLAQSISFEEIADTLGLNETLGFTNFGSGVSFVDFDEDGFDDLTVGTDVGQEILFYKNLAGQHFARIDLGIADVSFQKVVLWADIDNDNDYDFFLGSYSGQDRLYVNNGDNQFTDIAIAAGLERGPNETSTASFADVNNDGFLDLYVGTYCSSDCTNDLYINNGDNTFNRQTMTYGVAGEVGPNLATAFFDVDNDLDVDLYTSIDKIWQNKLFRNDGQSFNDISRTSNTDIVICAMNAGIGDFDNDQYLDIYVTNTPSGNVFLQNNGDETFTDITTITKTSFNSVCWGGNFMDINNDGFQDLYVCSDIREDPNKLYVNENGITYNEMTLPGDTTSSYANSFADFNNDGLLDIITVAGKDDPLLFYKNTSVQAGNYVKLNLTGTVSNKDAVGVWVKAYCDANVYSRFTHAGQAYLSQESKTVHIGLGQTETIDSLYVLWPSGITDQYYNLNVNRHYHLYENCIQNDTLELSSTPILHNSYHNQIIHSAGTVVDSIEFHVSDYAQLDSSFQVLPMSTFLIDIDGCGN